MSETPDNEGAGREAGIDGPMNARAGDHGDDDREGAHEGDPAADSPRPAAPETATDETATDETATDETATDEPASPEVGRAVAELASLSGLDLADHPDAYQRVHVELQNALASIDDA